DRAGDAPRHASPDHQLRNAGSRLRPRLRAEPGAQAGRRGGAQQRVRLRRHERHPRVPEVPPVAGAVSTDTARALGEFLDHDFADSRLLQQALTHRSYTNEHPDATDNDGLAFVGDAVLGLIVAEHLWAT